MLEESATLFAVNNIYCRIGGKGLVEVATIYKEFKLSLINALTQEGIGMK